MLIAVPTSNGQVCMHFGHCESFTVFDVDQNEKRIIGKRILTSPPHEPGVLPKWLHGEGVSVILAGGMGMRAQQLFAQAGVTTVVGVPPSAPEEVVTSYINGTLQTGDNVCDH